MKYAIRWSAVPLTTLWIALAWRETWAELARPGRLTAVTALSAAALVFACVPRAARALSRAIERPPSWAFVGVLACLAAGTSWYVVAGPMHGQVLSLDGAVYTFEARGLAHRSFGMPFPVPKLPFGFRFLFEGPDGTLHGVFPPGFPLFLVPFVALGVPLLAGPATAALLVIATWALGRTVAKTELEARTAALLSIPSWSRAMQTADPHSHAFEAVLAATAVVLAFGLVRKPSVFRAASLGVCVGWSIASRLLDGAVIAAVCGAIVLPAVVTWRIRPRIVATALFAVLPFLALLGAQQKAATGSWTKPTQIAYFERSDYPPTCHRLGFGPDVGCRAEHPLERASFGPDGFGPDDAWRVASERAGVFGEDLFGLGPDASPRFYGFASTGPGSAKNVLKNG